MLLTIYQGMDIARWYYCALFEWSTSIIHLNKMRTCVTLFSYCKWQTAGCRTGNETKHVLLHLPQASGPPLPPLALGLLPVAASPSPPLTITRQCCLEGTNQDVAVKSMTVIFWILSQWYAQRDCDNSIMHSHASTIKWRSLHCETECLQVPFTQPQLCVCMFVLYQTY